MVEPINLMGEQVSRIYWTFIVCLLSFFQIEWWLQRFFQFMLTLPPPLYPRPLPSPSLCLSSSPTHLFPVCPSLLYSHASTLLCCKHKMSNRATQLNPSPTSFYFFYYTLWFLFSFLLFSSIVFSSFTFSSLILSSPILPILIPFFFSSLLLLTI